MANANISDVQGGNFLTEPLNIADLLSTGSRFEIDTDFDRHGGLSDELFDDIGLGSDEDQDESPDFDPTLLKSPWLESFDSLRGKMVKINDYIYKRQVKAGHSGSGTVPDRARVSIEYTSYEEFSTQAFDSTFMRGHPHTFYTGRSEVIPGLEMAVQTMLQGEESQFVISYQVLFGEMGCPPRIKPKNDYLYVIKLLKFTDVGDVNAVEKVTEEDRNKFSVVYPKVKEVHKKGLDFFQLGNIQGAIKAFHNSANALNFCRLVDEAEEKEQSQFLVKLYTNLAVCYMKINLPAKVCLMCKELRNISNINKNPKALYNEGKALRMLGEFKPARTKLILAQKLQPNNPEIVKELDILAKTLEKYQKNEREICEKALGSIVDNSSESKKVFEEDEFENEMQELLNDFKNDLNIKTMPLPDGLTSKEVNCIEKLTKELQLKLSVNPLDNKSLVIIREDIKNA